MDKSEFLALLAMAVWFGLAVLADHLYDPRFLEPRGPMAEIGFWIRMACKWLAEDPFNNLKQSMYSLIVRCIIFAEFSFWVLWACLKFLLLSFVLLAIWLYDLGRTRLFSFVALHAN